MKKHPILTVVGVLLVIYLIIDALGALGFMPTIHMQKTPAPAATETAKPQSKMAPVVAKMFDNTLGDAFGDNYTAELDQENGIFRVNTWSPDTGSAFIEDAKAGGDSLKIWEATVDRVIYVTSKMQSTFDETCEEPITVVTSICDPDNHDLPYLTVANGVAGYNVVNGVDLLNK